MLNIQFDEINYVAVVISMIVTVISGSLWYNPKTFFPIWWKAIGKTKKDTPGKGNMGVVFGLVFVSSFIQPFLFAIILSLFFPEGVTPLLGVQTAILLWFGLIAPTYLVNKLFAGHKLTAWVIEIGNHLVNFVIYGIIFGFLG
jgi:hypothetical protein